MLDRRLLLVSGKGGVGKSAVAAALGIVAVRRDLNVLVAAMTDPAGLAYHLGVERLHFDPVEVRPGLNAIAVDRTRALDEYLRLQLHAPRVAPLTPLAKGLNALADTVPGIRDIITIGKLIYEVGTDRWDVVIVDAPPLGQVGSYLAAPDAIAGLVPVGRIRDQATRYSATLADPEVSALVLVSTLEELPVLETVGAIAGTAESIALLTVIRNRTLQPLGVGEDTLASVASEPHREAGYLHRALYESQRRWDRDLPPGPEIPFLFGVHTPAEVAVLAADALEESI